MLKQVGRKIMTENLMCFSLLYIHGQKRSKKFYEREINAILYLIQTQRPKYTPELIIANNCKCGICCVNDSLRNGLQMGCLMTKNQVLAIKQFAW